MKTKNKRIMIPIIAIILMALVGLVIFILAGADNTNKKLSRQLELGNKYLNEEDYERAIAAFDEALDIDPKCAEAYLGLADAYVGLGDIDEAKNILINGIDMFKSYGMKNEADILSDKLETINEETQDITDSEPSFEVHDVKGTWMEIGKSYDYKTITCGDEKYDAYGTVIPLSYEITSSYDDILADEDYEWRVLKLVCWFDLNDNGWYYGCDIGTACEDYYDCELHDNTSVDWIENSDYRQYTVRYQGTEQNTYESIKYEWTKFMKTNQCYITDAVMVPKGYDGCVLGLYDRTLEWRDGMYFYDVADDNSLLFRLGNDNIGELSTNIPYIEVDLSKVETLDSYYDPSDYRLCYLVYVGLDSVVDYENSTFRGPLDIEEYEGIMLRNWQYDNIYDDYRIDNPQIKDGLVIIDFRTYEEYIGPVTNSTHGSSGMGWGTESKGIVFDLNRGIVYSVNTDDFEKYSDYFGIVIEGKSIPEDHTRYSYPIIYEPDGGIVFSKNFHEDFYPYEY